MISGVSSSMPGAKSGMADVACRTTGREWVVTAKSDSLARGAAPNRVDEREVVEIAMRFFVLAEFQVGQVEVSGERELVPAIAAAVGGLESEIAAL